VALANHTTSLDQILFYDIRPCAVILLQGTAKGSIQYSFLPEFIENLSTVFNKLSIIGEERKTEQFEGIVFGGSR